MKKIDTIELLKKLIYFKSLTPDDDGAMEFIENYMSDFVATRYDKNGVKNLFLFKEGKNSEHLCFAGHIDVVSAKSEDWDYDPFIPTLEDGFIYGRGTSDMKGSIASFLNALKGINAETTISILLTSDEEGDGIYGTKFVLNELKKENKLPDFVILGEPTSSKILGDIIKIGRRGSIHGELTIRGKSSHIAHLKFINPIEKLSRVLGKISLIRLDEGDKYFLPSTLVTHYVNSGEYISNVTPKEVIVRFNVRNNIYTGVSDIENRLLEILKSEGVEDFDIKLDIGSKPCKSDENSKIVSHTLSSLKKCLEITPELNSHGGTSDMRYFNGEFAINGVELGLENERIHEANERVKVENVYKLENVYKHIAENFN